VTTASLLVEVANLHGQNTRLSRRITLLERRLSEALGVHAYQASSLGTPDVTAERQATLDQRVLELTAQLAERDDRLLAARAANRELMTSINCSHT
jgi:hypothetical protein